MNPELITLKHLVLNIGYVSNETNTDVRMYIEEFILEDLHALLYKLELRYNCIYTIAIKG